jgi:3-hydroxypropanoate dehydrogenase
MSLPQDSLDILFRNARTFTHWQPQPVEDAILHELYDLMKLGPTSNNGSPARIAFLRTPAAKERLRPALAPGNVDKTLAAPVTAILCYDSRFFDHFPTLAPHSAGAKERFAAAPEMAQTNAFRNASLQGGYFILAARAMGLDCGPMSGFDNAKVDAEFFANSTWKSNFLCNLGHGIPATLRPRAARLNFDQACQLL